MSLLLGNNILEHFRVKGQCLIYSTNIYDDKASMAKCSQSDKMGKEFFISFLHYLENANYFKTKYFLEKCV